MTGVTQCVKVLICVSLFVRVLACVFPNSAIRFQKEILIVGPALVLLPTFWHFGELLWEEWDVWSRSGPEPVCSWLNIFTLIVVIITIIIVTIFWQLLWSSSPSWEERDVLAWPGVMFCRKANIIMHCRNLQNLRHYLIEIFACLNPFSVCINRKRKWR